MRRDETDIGRESILTNVAAVGNVHALFLMPEWAIGLSSLPAKPGEAHTWFGFKHMKLSDRKWP